MIVSPPLDCRINIDRSTWGMGRPVMIRWHVLPCAGMAWHGLGHGHGLACAPAALHRRPSMVLEGLMCGALFPHPPKEKSCYSLNFLIGGSYG